MAIVLATFILAVQEILYLVYFALLFINDRSELNSLLSLLFLRIIEFGKVGGCVTNAFLGFAKLKAILIASSKIGEGHENPRSGSLEFLSSYKMIARSIEFLLHCKKMRPFERTRLIFFRNKNMACPSWIMLRFFHFNLEERRESVNLLMYVQFTDISKLLLCHSQAVYIRNCAK